MKKYFIPALFALFLSLFLTVHGQVEVEGRFKSILEQSLLLQKSSDFVPDVLLPLQNNTQLLELAEQESAGHKHVPLQFGKAIRVHVDANIHGQWHEDIEGNFTTWSCVIRSDGATSLSAQFSRFQLPEDGEFYAIGSIPMKDIKGAFTKRKNCKPFGEFAIAPVKGDTLFLEYYQPGLRSQRTKDFAELDPQIVIESIVHGFRRFPLDYDDSQSCHFDAACFAGLGWDAQIASVVVIISSSGERMCSGAMVNNGKQDGRQLLLTAEHCVTKGYRNNLVGFNYQHKSCGNSLRQSAKDVEPKTAHGFALLAASPASDFALFEVLEEIPDEYGVYLAGWDARKIQPKNVVCIHHPAGDVKKFSTFEGQTGWDTFGRNDHEGYHLRVGPWTKGSTESGSSGSPLFNKQKLIVGHLHGGQCNCRNRTPPDYFGALHYDWHKSTSAKMRLQDHLDPSKVGLKTLQGEYLRTLRRLNRSVSQEDEAGEEEDSFSSDEDDIPLDSVDFKDILERFSEQRDDAMPRKPEYY